jgi:hypothetical protein
MGKRYKDVKWIIGTVGRSLCGDDGGLSVFIKVDHFLYPGPDFQLWESRSNQNVQPPISNNKFSLL